MDPKLIERINELARLAKQRELTPEELAQRDALRRQYIDAFKENTRQLLSTVQVQHPDGTLSPLTPKEEKKPN